jgi:hypothetical protein
LVSEEFVLVKNQCPLIPSYLPIQKQWQWERSVEKCPTITYWLRIKGTVKLKWLIVCHKTQIHYRGGQLEIQFDSSTTVVTQLNPQGPIMQLQLSNGEVKLLSPNKPIEISTLLLPLSLSLSLSHLSLLTVEKLLYNHCISTGTQSFQVTSK